jgi:hypothetical protein
VALQIKVVAAVTVMMMKMTGQTIKVSETMQEQGVEDEGEDEDEEQPPSQGELQLHVEGVLELIVDVVGPEDRKMMQKKVTQSPRSLKSRPDRA